MIKIIERLLILNKRSKPYLPYPSFYYRFSTMETSKLSPQDIENQLKQLNIEYILHNHEAAMNIADLQQHTKLNHAPLIKNIFSEDKKGQCFLISARHDTVIERAFYKKLGTSYSNCRMAKPEVLQAVLGVAPGSVTPFGLANDTEKKVKAFALDENLLKEEWLSFHPLVNTQTIEIKRDDFLKWLASIDRKYEALNLSEKEEVAAKPEKKEAAPKEQKKGAEEDKDDTKLKIMHKKNERFSDWYTDVIVKGDLIEYYDVSGCYILRPWAYGIWESIQSFFDGEIKKLGVENAYFPIFVSQKALNKEKAHVEGFSAEVAWVTKYSDTDLAEPVAIRPTSETIMYNAYSKWISSHRDLPLKLNQWTNVVRWEFSSPTPFIRTREFLWQEGHTAHATEKEADEQTYAILELYRRVYEEVLAVPVIKGVKTESEKFAGGHYTTTVEAYIQENGRAVQSATSHNLGENFAKMFNIQYLDEKNEKKWVWQTSWGLTTRSIGIMIMVHGDDQGLVLPPRIAKIQAVIIPVIFKDSDKDKLDAKAKELEEELTKAGVRAKVDDRTNYSPGWKYNHWELKGVPLRIELGPKDLEKGEVRCVKRFDGSKAQLKQENLGKQIAESLEQIQAAMLAKATEKRNIRLREAHDWETFMKHLNEGCIVLTPWCFDEEEEKKVKLRSKEEAGQLSASESHLTGAAKTLCIPLEQEPIKEGEKCFFTGKPAKKRVLWGRSY
jgi:prolyl-tRNA synthetase